MFHHPLLTTQDRYCLLSRVSLSFTLCNHCMPKASCFCFLIMLLHRNIPQADALDPVTTIFNMQTRSAFPPAPLYLPTLARMIFLKHMFDHTSSLHKLHWWLFIVHRDKFQPPNWYPSIRNGLVLCIHNYSRDDKKNFSPIILSLQLDLTCEHLWSRFLLTCRYNWEGVMPQLTRFFFNSFIRSPSFLLGEIRSNKRYLHGREGFKERHKEPRERIKRNLVKVSKAKHMISEGGKKVTINPTFLTTLPRVRQEVKLSGDKALPRALSWQRSKLHSEKCLWPW